jgi:putative hemolysin
MSGRELSYVRAEDPVWKRWFMGAIEDLSGRRKLLPLYQKWRTEVVGKSPRMWSEALDMIGTGIEVNAAADWVARLPSGPVVAIANHPFGIADGIAMLALMERTGRPCRLLIHSDFMRVREVEAHGLPVDFSETKEALATNLKTRAEARRLLKDGVIIAIFPAGAVATAETPFGVAEDRPWKQFVARLIQQSGAAVLPVHFEGQNSPLFHFVSRYSQTLRLSLLVCEFRHRIGSTIRASVGTPAAWPAISELAKSAGLLDELYVMVHRLAPGADGRDRAELLPRPMHLRRQFPCDTPLQPGRARRSRDVEPV